MRKNKQTPTIKRLLCVLLCGLTILAPFDVRASTWDPTVYVNTESFQIVDDGDSTTDIELRFGGILNEILEFDRTNSRFHFTDDLLVDGTLSASGAVSFETSLDVSGATSGAWIHSEGSLSASGTLFLNGGTFTGATVFHGPFTSDCDDATNSKLLWDSSTGKFSCGTDQTGAGGMTQAQGDARFVNVSGDTMTGSLQIRSGSGVNAVQLEVVGTMSGRSLVVQGTASGSIALLTATGTTNRVGILTSRTNPPETELDVVGTISGTMLRVSSGASIHGGLTASGTVRFDGDILTLNDDQTADTNAVLTFGSDDTNETLSFADIGDRFELSDDIATTGSLNASGALLTDTGAKLNFDRDSNDVALTFGSDTANESITWYNTADLFEFSDDLEVNGSMSGITLTISSLKGCDTIDTNGNGLLACGTDDGGGGISQAQGDARYVNVSGDTMTGSLIVNKTGVNLVKTTTGTSGATDFSLAGSTLTNVTSQNDMITIDEGTVPAGGSGTMITSSVVTSAAVGRGGETILRDDGKYVIVHGNAGTTCSVWDGSSTTMTSATCAFAGELNGSGSIALKRPDGRYFILNGEADSAGSLIDPYGITAAALGPAICGAGLATKGTNAFLRPDGKYVILCGNLTAWGTYDPTANTYTAGTAVGTAFGPGAHAVQRDDGTFLVFRGAGTTAHWLYNPFASTTGTMTADPITVSPPTISDGAFSLRRKDGTFLVIGGAINASTIYDPRRGTGATFNNGAGKMTSQSGVGFGPTVALKNGAQAVWRQDGKYLLIIGNNSTVTNIIDPSKSDNMQFRIGPALPGTLGAGGHLIMRPDGRHQIIRGGGTTTTYTYNMGYIRGDTGTGTQIASYETECMTAPALGTGARLSWSANQEGNISFKVRTGNGSCSNGYRDVRENGDYIRPSSGDNRVQVKAFFKRQFPNFADQEWGLRRGQGQTVYRQINPDPTLHDLTVETSTLVHRTQFEFGNSPDASGPIGINIVNNSNKNLAISLAAGVGYGSTVNATNPQFYNGAFGTHPVLLATSTHGAIVLRRPDGNFVIIPGNTTADAQLYTQSGKTLTDLGVNPTAGTGLGALAFKRPDGKFFIVLGNLTTFTTIYDPIANTFTKGPALTAAAGHGALVIPLPTGRVLILHGNFTTTSTIYDPYLNTTVAGPVTSAVVGGGSMAIPRPDGTYFVVLGVTSATCTALQTTTNNFDPYTTLFNATGSPAITTGTGPGAFAFQRSDGQWVIVHGGGTVTGCAGTSRTQIYNPYTNKSVAGPLVEGGATDTVQNGGYAIPRPDGTWHIVQGNALTNTSIYLEKAGAHSTDLPPNIGQFIAGPALVTAASAGSISFQRDDGKFTIITGNGGTVMQQYDGGWVDRGIYKSEQMSVPGLDSTSTLTWKASPDMSGISAEVRTATGQQLLQTAVSREVPYSGAPISPSTNETWLRVHFNFKRKFPSYGGIFEDVWYSGGSPNLFPLRPVATPTLTEFRVNSDADLVSLRSNSKPVFRVSSNGDIFTGPQSAILTAGADISERYASTQALSAGDLVAFDPGDPHGVIRSRASYQPDVLGVISSNPGLVTGADTLQSFPVALMGRVPVKITDANGPIHAGDRLAASGIPGYAMKATQASRVVGMALESMDPEKLAPCEEKGGRPGALCGTVMMFVNLSDWPGPTGNAR